MSAPSAPGDTYLAVVGRRRDGGRRGPSGSGETGAETTRGRRRYARGEFVDDGDQRTDGLGLVAGGVDDVVRGPVGVVGPVVDLGDQPLEPAGQVVQVVDHAEQALVDRLALELRAGVEVARRQRVDGRLQFVDQRLDLPPTTGLLGVVLDALQHRDELVALVQRRGEKADVPLPAVAVDHRALVAVERDVGAVECHVELRVGPLGRLDHLVRKRHRPPPVGGERLADLVDLPASVWEVPVSPSTCWCQARASPVGVEHERRWDRPARPRRSPLWSPPFRPEEGANAL
ncbi:MAG: hypothetical protein ABEH78_09340 [Haloferacaceae archaeon]